MMMDAVHRFEGTVNQVLGDGIMALFGAPIAHEDHAPRQSNVDLVSLPQGEHLSLQRMSPLLTEGHKVPSMG